jgi:hypothetical protein
MNAEYWDEKFKLLQAMYHNNGVNGGQDIVKIIGELQQIAADQREACLKVVATLREKVRPMSVSFDEVLEVVQNAEIGNG